MVLDSSAVLAAILDEPEAAALERLIGEADRVSISAASVLESSMVLGSRLRESAEFVLNEWLREARAEVVGFDREQLEMARRGFLAFGRVHHPAALNFGDCFAYALAKTTGEPLLFKGTDFGLTDIECVSWKQS